MALGWLTENGWPSCAYQDCDLSVVPGTTVSIPVQIGIPNTILKAFLADLNAYVEPYNGEGDWGGWTATNSVATSNHLGGTAVDFNWNDHPMGPEAEDPNAGWKGSSLIAGDEVPAVRELLNFYEGMVFWGDDWDTPKDSMHFQMGYDTYDNIAKCMDFIGRKIRKDMFSVYKRGGTSQNGTVWPAGVTSGTTPPTTAPPVVTPPPPPAPSAPADPVDVLSRAAGIPSDRAASILPAVTDGLIRSQCNSPKRIAMWIAQEGEESASFTATVEIGNLDGSTYQGRTWEQITGQGNYAAFSQWAFDNKIPGVTSPTFFVDNPAALGDPQYESIGAAWYWTVARPQINSLADAGDVEGVTRAINGGTNGLDVRQANYTRALALGDDLLTLLGTTTTPADPAPAGEDDTMAGWTPDLVNRAMVLLENQTGVFRPSLSRFRAIGEGNIDTCGGFAWRADGNVHEFGTAYFATEYGDPQSILLLWTVAQNTDPDRAIDATLATRVLEHVSSADVTAADAHLQAWLTAEQKSKGNP